MKLRPVQVVWFDHCHLAPGQWVNHGDVDPELETVTSTGYLVAKDKRTVTLCQSFTAGGDMTGVFVIARALVKRIDKLRL